MTEGRAARPNQVFAVVVTFNPDLRLLLANLAAVVPQVDGVVIVDNGSKNLQEIRGAARGSGASLLEMGENRGMAVALNKGVARVRENGAFAVLLLDQDSICAPDMVEILTTGIAKGYEMAAPRIVDRNIPAPASRLGIEGIDYCITSGSLVRIDTWQTIVGFDEHLFIDYVDFDFCLRIRAAGGTLARCHEALLSHEIGQAVQHGRFVAYNHSPFRTRHMAEDMLVYARKHRRASPDLRVAGRGIWMTYAVLLRKAFIIARYEQDRHRKLLALGRGMAAGTFRRVSL